MELSLQKSFSLLFSLILPFCFIFIGFVRHWSYLDIFSPISILDDLIAELNPFIFPHILHLYSIVILFVIFVFFFQSFGPFLERLPRFPYPHKLLDLILESEPLDKGWLELLDLCLAVAIV